MLHEPRQTTGVLDLSEDSDDSDDEGDVAPQVFKQEVGNKMTAIVIVTVTMNRTVIRTISPLKAESM